MGLTIHEWTAKRLGDAEIAQWREIPSSIIGDELNRAQIMYAAIKPLAPGKGFAGQAITVQCMVGDNLALHHAISGAFKGAVIVGDGRANEETAIWGGIMHTVAETRGVAGVVIDGALRDAAELRASPLPIYARAAVPAGPHKGFGGEINAPIQCGGVSVHPGDLVVADDDGVVVVRMDQIGGLMERCKARMAKEQEFVKAIRAGKTTVEVLKLPGPGQVG